MPYVMVNVAFLNEAEIVRMCSTKFGYLALQFDFFNCACNVLKKKIFLSTFETFSYNPAMCSIEKCSFHFKTPLKSASKIPAKYLGPFKSSPFIMSEWISRVCEESVKPILCSLLSCCKSFALIPSKQ